MPTFDSCALCAVQVDGERYQPFHQTYVDGVHYAEIDCLVLEKSWHVLLGEKPMMPRPPEYNQLRYPRSYLESIAHVDARGVRRLARPCTPLIHSTRRPQHGSRGAHTHATHSHHTDPHAENSKRRFFSCGPPDPGPRAHQQATGAAPRAR